MLELVLDAADGGSARTSRGGHGTVSMTLPQYHRRECVINGSNVRLGRMLNKVLMHLLVVGPDRFVSRTEFVEAVWPSPNPRPEYASRMVDMSICRLRRHGVPIETNWGIGWRIPRFAREAAPERRAA